MLYQPPGELPVTEGAVDRLLRDMRVADSDLRSSNGYPGVLHFGSGSSAEPWLVLSYVEHMGWFIEFCGRVNGRDESFNPVSGDDYGTVGRAWTGDTWWVIPRAFFIGQSEAENAVVHFASTGGLDPSLSWLNRRDVTWDFFPQG